METRYHTKPAVLLLFILAAALVRILNAGVSLPLANFTPLGAMAIFGGAYLRPAWKAMVLPLGALLLSDLLIQAIIYKGQYGVLYGGWYMVYGIFLAIALLGRWIVQRSTVGRVLLAGLAGSLLHWMVADLFVWLGGGTDLRTMQPLSRDLAGLLQCYTQGFPFFLRFLAGTLLHSTLLFGGLALLRSTKPNWVLSRIRL